MPLTLSFPEGGALVTGGTGAVGSGIVRSLAEAGVPLVFTYKSSADKARAFERELIEQGHEVEARQMDAADTDSINAALDAVIARHGRVHTVSCGSGTLVSFDRLADFPEETVASYMNDDALGYYRIFRAAVARMRGSGGGSITTCTTLALQRHLVYDALSAFSKGAVHQLVRQMAAEEAQYNIRCNSVQIGWVLNQSFEQFRAKIPVEDPANPTSWDERLGVLTNEMYRWSRIKRTTQPKEAGDLFAFLASDQASFLTGQYLTFDGGMTL